VDLIHEDCNRVREQTSALDNSMEIDKSESVPESCWTSHLKRHKSIIVDLMAG
jgi:hypothetical protein